MPQQQQPSQDGQPQDNIPTQRSELVPVLRRTQFFTEPPQEAVPSAVQLSQNRELAEAATTLSNRVVSTSTQDSTAVMTQCRQVVPSTNRERRDHPPRYVTLSPPPTYIQSQQAVGQQEPTVTTPQDSPTPSQQRQHRLPTDSSSRETQEEELTDLYTIDPPSRSPCSTSDSSSSRSSHTASYYVRRRPRSQDDLPDFSDSMMMPLDPFSRENSRPHSRSSIQEIPITNSTETQNGNNSGTTHQDSYPVEPPAECRLRPSNSHTNSREAPRLDILPAQLLWTPWEPLRLKDFLRKHNTPVSTIRLQATMGNINGRKVKTLQVQLASRSNPNLRFALHHTLLGRTFYTQESISPWVPRTLPNLNHMSISTDEFGVNAARDIRRWRTYNQDDIITPRPQYFIVTRVTSGPSQTPPTAQAAAKRPTQPCNRCTLVNHRITATSRDMALAQAMCQTCLYHHFFQVEIQPANAMSRIALIRAMPTEPDTVITVLTKSKRTGNMVNFLEEDRLIPTLYEVDLARLNSSLSLYRDSLSRSRRPMSPYSDLRMSPDTLRTWSPEPYRRSRIRPMPTTPTGLQALPTMPQEEIYEAMLDNLKPIDMLQDSMTISRTSTGNIRGNPRTTDALPALLMTLGFTPTSTIMCGNIMAAGNSLPIIAGMKAKTQSFMDDTMMVENNIINFIVPHNIVHSTIFPVHAAGRHLANVREMMEELDGPDYTKEQMEDRLGLKPIRQPSRTILEAFIAQTPTTRSTPMTVPQMTKIISTFQGIQVIPRHLAHTVPVQGDFKIPLQPSLPILR